MEQLGTMITGNSWVLWTVIGKDKDCGECSSWKDDTVGKRTSSGYLGKHKPDTV